jgi:4-amino-4-deoxy-L-arabinose transferase-like glycosyltransferase
VTRRAALGVVAVLVYAFALLSIGLARDWELLHEDNGALHTTFALSHLRLGLARTRAHDYFFEPRSGLEGRYGAHPPGPGLLLAGAFGLAGSDTPAVARLTAIGFQLGTVLCTMLLAVRLFDGTTALAGGALMATLPMAAFFGRMVNYEPFCLLAVMLQLLGYVVWRQGAPRRGLALMMAGVAAGGLIDWPAFFFAAAILIALVADAVRAPAWRGARRAARLAPVAVLAAWTGAVLAIDLAHLWVVGTGSIGSLRLVDRVLARAWLAQWHAFDPLAFAVGQLEMARRYFTDAGLVSALAVAGALIAMRWAPAAALLRARDTRTLRRVVAVSGGAAAAYVLVAPTWARIHAYWQFYALPFVVLAMLVVARALVELGRTRAATLARVLLAAFVLDTVIASATTLHYRHTTRSSHAVRQVAELRANAMAPAYLERARR